MSIICDNTSIQLFIHPIHEVVSEEIRRTGTFYEISFLNYIAEHYGNQHEIIDIGANIGNHSTYFAEYFNCSRIHAFEPHPVNLNILHKNIDRYGDKCVIYDVALSNNNGEMTLFNSCANNYGGFSLHAYKNSSSFVVRDTIPVKTLDSFNLKNITMIKIDVENHENEVLEGSKKTIMHNRPIIFLENLYHGFPAIQPDINIHADFFRSVNYTKADSNILGSYMDLWIPL